MAPGELMDGRHVRGLERGTDQREDHALRHEGSYFLTYHRFARREQVLAAHPRMRDFLAAKRHMDPAELFQSDWYRAMRDLLA